MRVPFASKYEYMTKIYFHTPEARAYSGEIFIGPRSLVTEVIVDRVELRNPLGGLQFRPVKTKCVLYTAREIRQMRVSAAKENNLFDPLRPQPLSASARAQRDEIIIRDGLTGDTIQLHSRIIGMEMGQVGAGYQKRPLALQDSHQRIG